MKLPSPGECGLPEKFDRWRPNQEEALDRLRRSTTRARALCSPTGSGKTLIYVTDAILSKEPTCFVTDNRALQDQLMDDYSSIGMVDIRGRNNYTCDLKEDYTCEDGYAARCPYKGTVACPSSAAEMRAAASSLVVTNYPKWIAARKFGQGMAHFKRVVFDEGHRAPDALAEAMQVRLSAHEVQEILGLDFPHASQAETFAVWKPWAAEARALAEQMMLAARSRITSGGDPPQVWVRHFTHLRNLTRRLGIISTANPTNWIVEELPKGYQFDPIRPGRYAESTLLLRVPSITVVSATLRPKTMFMIGIGKKDFEFHEYPSDFDPKRCPIYWIRTMRVDKRAQSLAMVWARLDQVASRRRDRNGIVHTISFTRRDEVVESSRFSSSMLINERGEPATEMVQQFKETYPGAILVSPSVGAGFDFPGRQCEWQFVCKIPFPPPSLILKARTDDDPEYPYYLAMQKLVQNFGRGMRSREDQCENFIPDDHLEWFLPRYGHLAPRWFHNFVREVTTLPQPPPKL